MTDSALAGLDGAAVRVWAQRALDALDAARTDIDALNVFPVPDADTGTNLCLTLRAAVEFAAHAGATDARGVLAGLARGAVLGARGNSGVIMAQVLRGLADAAPPAAVPVGAEHLRVGLERGAELAYAAVAEPVEGTILTVARSAAQACIGSSLESAVNAALAAAQAALERTPQQLVALERAGVVDAGGQGLVLVLGALARTVGGGAPTARLPLVPPRPRPQALPADVAGGDATFQYEVQYLLQAGDDAAMRLRVRLADLGDSVAVAGTGDGTWNVHAHVDDVGAAIEAGVAAGATRNISVVRFADQIAATGGDRSLLVVLVEGVGLARLFAREGVNVVDSADPEASRNVMAVASHSGAREIVLLPNDPGAAVSAEFAATRLRADGIRVVVVPTRSPVQGLAAVAVHDASRRFDDDVVAMAEAAAATRFAEVRVAQGPALTSAGVCSAGDVLGLIDADVVEIGSDVLGVGLSLVDRLLGVGAELVTVLLGAEAPDGAGTAVTRRIRTHTPLTEVCVYQAGQPDSPLILGVE